MRYAASGRRNTRLPSTPSIEKEVPYYNFTSFCGECFRNATLEWKKRADEVDRILLARKKRKEEMVIRVKELSCSERVPIRYAVEKLLKDVKSVYVL